MSWKNYGIITEILTNEGSNVADLAVSANTGASENYPEARIVIGSTRAAGKGGVEGFAISVAKWRELERLVDRACVDITAACPAHGDLPLAVRDDRPRPELLRAYLEHQYRTLVNKVDATFTSNPDNQLAKIALAGEAELVLSFLRWMDEAGLAR